jgi:hypothetical protein
MGRSACGVIKLSAQDVRSISARRLEGFSCNIVVEAALMHLLLRLKHEADGAT